MSTAPTTTRMKWCFTCLRPVYRFTAGNIVQWSHNPASPTGHRCAWVQAATEEYKGATNARNMGALRR